MNLKSYTRQDCGTLTNGVSSLRVTTKGTFTINKFAVNGIGLKVNDKIEILQDQDRPADWYIKKSDHPEGFILRKQSCGALICNAQAIAKILLNSIDKANESVTLRMATTPEEGDYYAILTRSAKKQDQ
ncbi:hypothetical protein [uncultured Draconibacterium sp.]|uniref:hypothetical protein n=1 Tax=uncultured Draconibacterium sp. TaxID=1573823 RepID=UPI0029C895C1|nr:hypothetical protein [uncultured Draconibacterium sp.]